MTKSLGTVDLFSSLNANEFQVICAISNRRSASNFIDIDLT